MQNLNTNQKDIKQNDATYSQIHYLGWGLTAEQTPNFSPKSEPLLEVINDVKKFIKPKEKSEFFDTLFNINSITTDSPIYKQTFAIYNALAERNLFTEEELRSVGQFLAIRVFLSNLNKVMINCVNKNSVEETNLLLDNFLRKVQPIYATFTSVIFKKTGSFPNPLSVDVNSMFDKTKYMTGHRILKMMEIQENNVSKMIERFDKIAKLKDKLPEAGAEKPVAALLQLLSLHELPSENGAIKNSFFLSSIFTPNSVRIKDLIEAGYEADSNVVKSLIKISSDYKQIRDKIENLCQTAEGSILTYKEKLEEEIYMQYYKNLCNAQGEMIKELSRLCKISPKDMEVALEQNNLLSNQNIKEAANFFISK